MIIRRPAMLALAERLDLDRRGIRGMQRLRDKYGTGPLRIRLPGRSLALVLGPRDLHRVLADTPQPFATDSPEKRAALAHFEPKNVLISDRPERAERHRFNEEALQPDRPLHTLAESFLDIVAQEAGALRDYLPHGGELDWKQFSAAWSRVVRRVIFGDAARQYTELSTMMTHLRAAANWAFLRPQRTRLREQLLDRIRGYLARAEPESLAGAISQIQSTAETAPEHQVPQWLFAFDPAGMTTFRSLALLTAYPHQARRARDEIAGQARCRRGYLPFLRATVLESLRLWPTSPLILRETTADTTWETGVLPAHTGMVIFAPFFRRDDERLPFADNFAPDLWLEEGRAQNWPLIPFSEGPAACPGRQLVLLLSTAMLAGLLEIGKVRLRPPGRLRKGERLPAALNHFSLRFEFRRAEYP